jgi:hypothetical protein
MGYTELVWRSSRIKQPYPDAVFPVPGTWFSEWWENTIHVLLIHVFRDAITKMKDVYLKNPQMGDPASLDHKLTEVSQNIDKLRLEVQKFEVREAGVGRSLCAVALLRE